MFSTATSIPVREEIAFQGVRQQQANPNAQVITPTDFTNTPEQVPLGGLQFQNRGQLEQLATQLSEQPVSRSHATSAEYPAASAPRLTNRNVVPKNMVPHSQVGRDIGRVGADLGGHMLRDRIGSDLDEHVQVRTTTDFTEAYKRFRGPSRPEVGPGTADQADQGRMNARPLSYKNTAGRFAGPMRDMRNPNHPTEKLTHESYKHLKDTRKADDAVTLRNHITGPDRDGLRPQYADVYSSDWNSMEKVEPFRRKNGGRERDIDESMIQAYQANPLTPLIGAVYNRGIDTPGAQLHTERPEAPPIF